jgi:hypothetical protein
MPERTNVRDGIEIRCATHSPLKLEPFFLVLDFAMESMPPQEPVILPLLNLFGLKLLVPRAHVTRWRLTLLPRLRTFQNNRFSCHE